MKGKRIGALIASAAILGAGAGGALAHGGPGMRGPGPGPGGDDPFRGGPRAALFCDVPDAQLLTTATSTVLARLDARLDAAVAAGRITQARADRMFSRTQQRLSLRKIRNDAQWAPVLTLLNTTLDEVKAAAEEGISIRELAELAGVSRADLRAAIRAGRQAARAAVEAVCNPEDDEDEGGYNPTV